MAVTTSIMLDTRYESKKHPGKYPVRIRVYDGRRKRTRLYQIEYYHYKLYITRDQWEKIQKKGVRDNALRELKLFLGNEEERARKVIKKLLPFTFAGFERLWYGEDTAGTLAELFKQKIEEVTAESTKNVYRYSLKNILEFDKRELLPHDITVSWLKRFEKFLVSKGNSSTTAGFYIKPIKAVLNAAIASGNMDKDLYPFGRSANKYSIPKGRKVSRVLSSKELDKLFAYEAEKGSPRHFSLNIFKLSFYLAGMNMADLFRLTEDNIQDELIVYTRQKTEGRVQDPMLIKLPYSQIVKEILEVIGNKDESIPYLLPGLKPGLTEKQELNKLKSITTNINHHLQEIAKEIGINEKVSTYFARHTFATMLRDQSISAEQISKLMGNSPDVVNKHYLGHIEIEKMNEIFSRLNPGKGHRASDE